MNDWAPTPDANGQYFQSKEQLNAFLRTVNTLHRQATGKSLIHVIPTPDKDNPATHRYATPLATIPEGYVAIVRPGGLQLVPEKDDPFSDEHYAETVSRLPYRFYDPSVLGQEDLPAPPSAAATASSASSTTIATPHDQTPASPNADTDSST